MATATSDADEIRLKMAQIRRDLHSDVREVVANAEAVTDWKRYVKMYPWAALGVSVAVGYLIVPKRRRTQKVVPVSDIVSPAVVQAAVERQEAKTEETQSKGLVGLALGFITPIALRAAQGYAVQYLESWIAQQQEMAMSMGAAGARSPSGPAQPDHYGGPGRPQPQPPKPKPPF